MKIFWKKEFLFQKYINKLTEEIVFYFHTKELWNLLKNMKKDKIITCLLIGIIIILTGYIIYDKLNPKWEYYGSNDSKVNIIDEIR